jgi:hypothetical protein
MSTHHTLPAWARIVGGRQLRGPNPAVAHAVLWALHEAGTYGATAKEIADATGMGHRNVLGCLCNLRARWAICYARSDESGRWTRHFAAFVKTDEAQAAVEHWLADLAEQRKAKAKASAAAFKQRQQALNQANAAQRAELRAKVKRDMQAARERKAEEAQAAARLRLAKAHEAAHNNVLAKKIRGTRQPSLAPVKPENVTIVWPDDVKVTVAPKPVGRFELLQPAEGGLRSLPIGKYLEPISSWAKAATGADPCAL